MTNEMMDDKITISLSALLQRDPDAITDISNLIRFTQYALGPAFLMELIDSGLRGNVTTIARHLAQNHGLAAEADWADFDSKVSPAFNGNDLDIVRAGDELDALAAKIVALISMVYDHVITTSPNPKLVLAKKSGEYV